MSKWLCNCGAINAEMAQVCHSCFHDQPLRTIAIGASGGTKDAYINDSPNYENLCKAKDTEIFQLKEENQYLRYIVNKPLHILNNPDMAPTAKNNKAREALESKEGR